MKKLKTVLLIVIVFYNISCKNGTNKNSINNSERDSNVAIARKGSEQMIPKELRDLPLQSFPFGPKNLNIKKFPVQTNLFPPDSIMNIFHFQINDYDRDWFDKIFFHKNPKAKNFHLGSDIEVNYLKFDDIDSTILDRRYLADSSFLYKLPDMGPYKLFFGGISAKQLNDTLYFRNIGDLILYQPEKNSAKVINILTESGDFVKYFYIDTKGTINIFRVKDLGDELGSMDYTKVAEITVDSRGQILYKRIKPIFIRTTQAKED